MPGPANFQLTNDNLILFAAKHYHTPRCIDTVEFFEDLNRFKYIKRLVSKYQDGGPLAERLILNHLIVIFNVFGIEPALQILELKFDASTWEIIKPFLIFLRYIRNDQYTAIPMDKTVVEALRKINEFS